MKKLLLMLLFLAAPCFLFAQNVVLTGKVTDPDNNPLEAATVYFNSAKDSTLIDYTITNKNGQWQLKTKAFKTPVYFKIAFVGLKGYRKKLEEVTKDTDFGTIKLEDSSTELGEVVVQGEVPPIRIKKDTLEFNAASFNIKPDANLQELLKQLPGLEIDAEGKITMNGKEVNQILVNGKPFFDKDGKIALQNLPAEIINKIQITATKTKEEELSGQKSSSNNASINITIDEEKNKGMFGRATVGFGSSGRYERSLLVNYFKGERKLSLLASSNNINSVGFSMDEIFDNMSGGRNQSMWSNGSSFNINGMQFGGDTGITRSNILGLNYADKWVKGFDGGASYFYTDAKTNNVNRSAVTNFVTVPEGSTDDLSYTTKGQSVSNTYRYSHNYSSQFNIAIDSTFSIYLEPKLVRAYNRSTTSSSQVMRRLSTDALLTDTNGEYGAENNNNTFSNMLVLNKSLKSKKGRSVSFYFRNENNRTDDNTLNNTITDKYTYDGSNATISTETRNLIRNTKGNKDEYVMEAKYYEPIKDSAQVMVSMVYSNNKKSENRRGYNFNPVDNSYNAYNDIMSGDLQGTENRFSPRIGYSVTNSKVWFNIAAGPRFINFDTKGMYTGIASSVSKNYIKPFGSIQMNYQLGKTQSVWVSYDYNVTMPDADQLLEVPDVINQLSSSVGYSLLKPTEEHSIYFNFNNYDWNTRTGYSFYGGGDYNSVSIAGYSEVDDNAIITNSYRNVNDTYSGWGGANYGKSFKVNAHEFKVNLGMHSNFMLSKGYLNEELYEGRTLWLRPNVNFIYKYGELLTVNPFYRFDASRTTYKNYAVNEATSNGHRLGINTTSYWPKHLTIGNDFTYSYNPQQAAFRKDFYLWNASIGYAFWKDKLTFKTKIYDLLNQNQGITRTVSARSISEQENTVLKRYVMFSLSLKLDKFAGKKDATTAGNVIAF